MIVRSTRTWIVLGVLATLLGCSDKPSPVDPGRPALDVSASTSDEVTVALPQDPHETWVAGLPINTYANPTLIEVVLRGSITAYYYDQTSTYWPLWGVIDARGLHTNLCYGRVWVRYSNGVGYSPRNPDGLGDCPMPPGDPQEFRALLTVQGSGTVSRTASPGGPYGCNGGPCRLYTGGPHTVTVRRIPAELKLSPTKASIAQGATVTFTAAITPSTYEGQAMPFQVQSWRWQPDSGAGAPVCGTGQTCSLPNVTQSGTMTVTALVNGVVDSATARVTIVPCPTGNALLDDLLIRDSLAKIWNSTGYNSLPGNQRRERGLNAFDSSGVQMIMISPPNISDTPCSTQNIPGSPPPVWQGWRHTMDIHGHPFRPGDSTDPLPIVECQLRPLGPTQTYVAKPGPSSHDFRRAYYNGDSLATFVLEPDTVYLLHPMKGPGTHTWQPTRRKLPDGTTVPDSLYMPNGDSMPSYTDSWPRKVGACVRF